MKKVLKSTVSVMCMLAMLLSLFSIIPMGASAYKMDGVQPRPVQRQWDSKWKSYYIGGRTMYDTACGIFSIVNSVGYATGNTMDVMEVARWAYSIKAFNYSSGGTTRNMLYPYLQGKYGTRYGFTVNSNGTSGFWGSCKDTRLKNHLLTGGTVIGHVKGHFITVVDYDASTNKYRIFDSAPSSSRKTNVTGEYGYGDAWVTQSWFSTSTKLTLDWYVLVTATGTVINNGTGAVDTVEQIGTWQLNSKAPASDALNIRDGASSSGTNVVGTAVEGDLVYTSEFASAGSNWGKVKKMDGSGVEGWAAIKSYADYIGIDALGGTPSLGFGDMSTYIDAQGRRTFINNSATDGAGYDMLLPIDLGTSTTPYLSLQITPNSGNGYYFGISELGSGYWMMRECTSGDQLVKADSASWMTDTETLEIDLRDWWKPADGQKINVIRFYVAPNSSITVNYCYFAATKGKVTDTTYNIIRQEKPIVNENLMDPATLAIIDTNKGGSYVYDNGTLTVTADTIDGYGVVLTPGKDFSPADVPNWLFDLSATTGFDIQIEATTSEGNHSFGLVSEFWPGLCDALVDGYLPAGDYFGVCDIHSCYTWNNFLPTNGISRINYVRILLSGPGTVTVKSLQLSNTSDIVKYADGVYKAEKTEQQSDKGDVNNDGSLSSNDARLVLGHTTGIGTLTAEQQAKGDVDGNATLDSADLRKMLLAMVLKVA
ncbi:MAG: dockerin type I repeat-containing protein [Clostridia bacterium]|nr:dockerin type I repeat-containing protein [Clostridia bacterium]